MHSKAISGSRKQIIDEYPSCLVHNQFRHIYDAGFGAADKHARNIACKWMTWEHMIICGYSPITSERKKCPWSRFIHSIKLYFKVCDLISEHDITCHLKLMDKNGWSN